MSDIFDSDQGAALPKVCPSCDSTKFQKGPEGGVWSFNVRCENGHILLIDLLYRKPEVVGFQARNTKGVFGEPKEVKA